MNAEAEELAAAVERTLPGWVRRSVERLLVAWQGEADPAVLARADAAGAAAVAEVGPQLRRLLATDIDRQWTNPLSIVRGAVRHPTAVLREAGVPEVVRDPFDEASFPDDVYAPDAVQLRRGGSRPAGRGHPLGGGEGAGAPGPPRGRPSARGGVAVRVVALVPDLMDRSKVAAVAPGTEFVARAGALPSAAAGADLVVVDLSRPGAVEAIPALAATGVRVIGFGSHVDRATLDAAEDAGASVLPRSEFFRRLSELLAP